MGGKELNFNLTRKTTFLLVDDIYLLILDLTTKRIVIMPEGNIFFNKFMVLT